MRWSLADVVGFFDGRANGTEVRPVCRGCVKRRAIRLQAMRPAKIERYEFHDPGSRPGRHR
ncbi:hypothetical protein [Amycolatopsis sp. lyj-84]|uniref:hypothetical protein n=1 Tax=Amycolatopsis sp. lyj-84 TaxID=2789284 RepID=UPI0039799AA4